MLRTGPHIPVSYTAKDARTVGDMFAIRAARSGPLPAMFEKNHNRWEPMSWMGFYSAAAAVAKGLLDSGLKPGDRVAILGATRAGWSIYDMGCQLAGMVSLGIYPKQSPEQIRYLIDHSDARVLDQLLYKWPHSREIVWPVLAEQYAKLVRSGWDVCEDDVRRDVALLFGGAFEAFMEK